MKKRNIKSIISEAAVCAVVLAILLTILIPTIARCIENGDINKYRSRIETLTSALNSAVASDNNAKKWLDLIQAKNSRKLFEELTASLGANKSAGIDPSEYYLQSSNGSIYVKCTKYPDIDSYKLNLPGGFTMPSAAPSEGDFSDHLHVIGVRTYMQNESINPSNPEQMRFSAQDNLKEIFSDLSVELHNVGGLGKKVLSPDEYTLSTEGFDMSVPGTKRLKLSYKTNSVWNKTMYADFTFEVLKRTKCPPLVISFGDKGSYELAAWDWTDYIAEASQNEGLSKDFDASIVHFENKYYYYPDGFNIDSRRSNTSPDNSAADIDDPTRAAYRLEFKPNIIIGSKEDAEEMKSAEHGALMLEEGQVYIWQTEASKELDAGWIRVYCELKKTA